MRRLVEFLLLVLVTKINCEEKTFNPESSTFCTEVIGEIHRFHNETQKCYKVGTKGPCGDLMIFYADPTNDVSGECDCDAQLRCQRPLIYWEPKDRCYLAYDQGPCEFSEWLVLHGSKPFCKYNPCGTNQTTNEFEDEDESNDVDGYWIESYGGECVKTNTQGFCKYPNEVVAMNGYSKKIKPYCTVIKTTCTTPSVPSLFCSLGQKWSVTGICDMKSCTKKNKRNHHRRPHHHHRRPHHHRGHRRHHHHHHHKNGIDTTTTDAPITIASRGFNFPSDEIDTTTTDPPITFASRGFNFPSASDEIDSDEDFIPSEVGTDNIDNENEVQGDEPVTIKPRIHNRKSYPYNRRGFNRGDRRAMGTRAV